MARSLPAMIAHIEAQVERLIAATGSFPALLLAVIFGVANGLAHGRLDTLLALSNGVIKDIGFVMFFVLAFIGQRATQHAKQANDHARHAAAQAARMTEKLTSLTPEIEKTHGHAVMAHRKGYEILELLKADPPKRKRPTPKAKE